MRRIEEVLEKVYANKDLRRSIVPLFIGDPGMGKTKIIEKFAREKDANLVELITSQMSPFEISGIAMPDKETKKMTYYNFDKLELLKDGDILFFDELLNGNPVVLNACLTILEQRRLISGKDLPDVMIIAAANPQGMVPITPQIKERFVWYNVQFDEDMWKEYMTNKYPLPNNILDKFCKLIKNEKFISNNFNSPRSLDKAINMVGLNCPTPYEAVVTPLLRGLRHNRSKDRSIKINDEYTLKPGESINYIDILKPFNKKAIKTRVKKKATTYSISISNYSHGYKGRTENLIWQESSLTRAGSKKALNERPTTILELLTEKEVDEIWKKFKSIGAEVKIIEVEDKGELFELKIRSKGDIVNNTLTYLNKTFGFTEKEALKILNKPLPTLIKEITAHEAKEIENELQDLGVGVDRKVMK